ncbi:MAG TPA: carboxypeptidase-like regulatory domain-containing protein [Candidatus Thermoplasmatota archaeon]|nr:carboxypeptidase-like regulatory domain-containing protein [Candidatus Thermoplasmatota archaeon]
MVLGRAVIAFGLAVALAGCGTPAASGEPADVPEGLDELALAATATTGLLRGVVVDDAIRPIANASVTARGPAGERTAVTGADGLFGFDGLEPGTWFVSVSKVAYQEAQVSTEVVAGVDDPDVLKVLLVFVPGEAPFLTELNVEAFVQCIIPGANMCAIINLYPCAIAGLCDPIVDDTSFVLIYDEIIGQKRTPDWFQTEMVWQSTQSVSAWLSIRSSAHSPDDGAGLDERIKSVIGPSPLVVSLDKENATEWETGTEEGISYEIFGANEYTCPLATPVGNIGLCGGFVLNQRVSFYFHVFYGYTPPEGWQFSVDGAAQPPR